MKREFRAWITLPEETISPSKRYKTKGRLIVVKCHTREAPASRFKNTMGSLLGYHAVDPMTWTAVRMRELENNVINLLSDIADARRAGDEKHG